MANLFLIAIVTPLALLVLNIVGVMSGRAQLDANADPVPAPSPVAVPARPARARRRASLVSAVRRADRHHRRNYFGDFAPAPAPVHDSLGADVDLRLTPRREPSTAAVPVPSPTAHARPGGTLVALPSRAPLAAQRSVAQR